jgi:glucose-1-phosphate adenylyltransferase
VPLGGKFRLIDVPISNSLHAGIDRIYVLTQFHSASLHRHITQTFRFDQFRGGFVDILAADERQDRRDWYQGTADAIRQNLQHLDDEGARDVLILSGDQLYLMNVRAFVKQHRIYEADLTVAVTAVPRSQASGLGLVRVDRKGKIVEFVEKPTEAKVLDRLAADEQSLANLGIDAATLERLRIDASKGVFLASMGIYTFRRSVLHALLDGTSDHDFGKEILPAAIRDRPVFAYGYGGYWRDIGTIPSFHEASLELTHEIPPLNLYDPDLQIYTHARHLPGTKINRCTVEHSILGEGSIINGATIRDSILGIRAQVQENAVIERSVVMGQREYEPLGGPGHGKIPMGIGRGCVLRNAIVDLNARIGDGAKLVNAKGVKEAESENYCIRGGIIVVPSGATIPAGTEI